MKATAPVPIRYLVNLPTRFRSEGDINWIEGQLANLSVSGLCLLAPEADLLPGQKIEFIIETMDKFLRKSTRRVRAKVIWSKDGKHGVQFSKRAKPHHIAK